MSKIDIIKKALIQNNVLENDIVVIKTDTTTIFSIRLFKMLVSLLIYFAMPSEMTASEIYNFIMQNFNEILDIVITELEIALHNFIYINNESIIEEIKLDRKEEILLTLAIQNKVKQELNKIILD